MSMLPCVCVCVRVCVVFVLCLRYVCVVFVLRVHVYMHASHVFEGMHTQHNTNTCRKNLCMRVHTYACTNASMYKLSHIGAQGMAVSVVATTREAQT
jgi:hypothetical protein